MSRVFAVAFAGATVFAVSPALSAGPPYDDTPGPVYLYQPPEPPVVYGYVASRAPRVYGYTATPRVYGYRATPRVYGYTATPRVYGYGPVYRYTPPYPPAAVYGYAPATQADRESLGTYVPSDGQNLSPPRKYFLGVERQSGGN